MKKNTSIDLDNIFDVSIARQVDSALAISKEELKFVEDQEAKLLALRKALIDGEKSGSVKCSLKDLIKELDQELSHKPAHPIP